MHIQWYPGHMTKSIRMIGEQVKHVDAVLYVLDARAPGSCINPSFTPLIQNKPIVYLLNKSDLAEPGITAMWERALTGVRTRAFGLNASVSKSTAGIFTALKALCAEKLDRYKAKGANAAIKAMVIGVPNTGKSTIINNLCGRAKAVTGNRPGVTRGRQWVRVTDYLEVLDTPGTLYPKFDDQDVALRLCVLGCIKDEITDILALSMQLIRMLAVSHQGLLHARYGVDESQSSETILGEVARRRGLLVRGGEPDLDRAATAVLDDFRKGRMGRISLESPEREGD